MTLRRWFSLGFLPTLSTIFLASDGEPGRVLEGSNTTAGTIENGSPVLFSWADYDGDGRLDIAAVGPDGTLQLLANVGEGRFEDVTERVGLSGVENAALALWADYDGDSQLDLFVGAREGKSRLFKNDGGVFVDMTAGSGLSSEGAVQSAHWLDHDGDGRLDLHVVTMEKNSLFRGLEGGFFELCELPIVETVSAPALGVSPVDTELGAAGEDVAKLGTPSAPGSPDEKDGGKNAGGSNTAMVSLDDLNVSGGRVSSGPTPGGVTPLGPFPLACASSIKDQANPGSCLLASTTPALGRLYPLSTNLFVAALGNVGIGTTSPTAKLHVAGSARIAGPTTLAPSNDFALNVASGSIYKGGQLFLHTKGGGNNSAFGHQTLASVTTGVENTASGFGALNANTTGDRNTASGSYALAANTIGDLNTADGHLALAANTTGNGNTAHGAGALLANTTGSYNVASGLNALISNTTGRYNVAQGVNALRFNTTGKSNTASGQEALSRNTVGSFNTASGYQALFFNTTGGGNTGLGTNALHANTTGSYNTASGMNALLSNTYGHDNTASGSNALRFNTTGSANTAIGSRALYSNPTGVGNTATGYQALFSNTNGSFNTASGIDALSSNTLGSSNTASGYRVLRFNTTGIRNTAFGANALFANTTGDENIGIGEDAGASWTTGDRNIAIGNGGSPGESLTTRIGSSQTRAFIAGIRGVTTGLANAIPVLIDSNGQLGTASSSGRFKKEIRDMGDLTERLLELRPVVFRYKQEQEVESGEVPLEYGLIAEEVAEIFPDLVVYDEEGLPFTVRYHLLSSMLLNELKKQAREMKELRERLEGQTGAHQRELEKHASDLAALRGRLIELESRASSAGSPAGIPACVGARTAGQITDGAAQDGIDGDPSRFASVPTASVAAEAPIPGAGG